MAHRPKKFYKHMNPVIAEMIRHLYFVEKWKQQRLAVFFQIGQSSVSKIISNQIWSRP